MNFRLLSFFLGKLCLTCGAALLLPSLLALYGDEKTAYDFLSSSLIAGSLGFFFVGYGNADGKGITYREGVAIVGLGWLIITLLGSLPYIFAGVLDPVSAFFESVSGFTTTGVTAFEKISSLPSSVLLWQSMTHWFGGIGIVVVFIALLPQVGSGTVHMFNAEVTGPTAERVMPRIKNTALVLFKIYALFTLSAMLLLMLAGMSVFDAVTHSLSTIAAGGFSNYDDGIAHFNSPLIEGIITFFMIVAGSNFGLYYQASHNGLRALWQNTEFRAYVSIIVLMSIAIAGNLYYNNVFNGTNSLRYSIFHVTSVISTTGFVSGDFNNWPTFSKLGLLFLMVVGGCAGSTAGGIKVSRLVVLVKMVFAHLKGTFHPSMVFDITMNGKTVPSRVIAGIARFFFLCVVVFAVLSFLMAASGLSVVESISIIAATISSVGPVLGVAEAAFVYSEITPFGKMVVCLSMLLGRLELFTLLVLLRPEFWRSTRYW